VRRRFGQFIAQGGMTVVRKLVLLLTIILSVGSAACIGLTACQRSSPSLAVDPKSDSWPDIVAAARGQTVTMAMWQGDPGINAYMRDFVVPVLIREDAITLKLVPGQGDSIVNALMTETEAGRSSSAFDLVWINGETFYQLRQIRALYGPFTQALPNQRYIDWSNPFISSDFQQPLQGYECPWGNVQLLLITDRNRVPQAPTDPTALAAWIHAHPGRFTFDTGFTGMSFLKSLMYAFAARPEALGGPFNRETYQLLRDKVFAWVASVRNDLWHHGETFPVSTAQLHQLFADGEVDFSMSYNDGEVDNRIENGLFPQTAMAYALHTGTLQNTHYLGIVDRSTHKAAAMVVADFLISPRAQLRKLDAAVWGDGTVLDVATLPDGLRERFAKAAVRAHGPGRAAIQPYARAEPAPQVMIEVSRDFRQRFLHE
jgi:putative spermidine/putrescine transport system substrate-binding protein